MFRRPGGKVAKLEAQEQGSLFYHGVDGKRNGVGDTLKEEFVRNVLEVKECQ